MSLEVRIRSASDNDSSYLCEVELADVPDVIPTIKTWGLMGYEDSELSGQFVMSAPHRPSYFEVIVQDD